MESVVEAKDMSKTVKGQQELKGMLLSVICIELAGWAEALEWNCFCVYSGLTIHWKGRA